MTKILLTIIALTISTIANAEYVVKVPLEVAQGGTLPNGSIKIANNQPPAPTVVSTQNVCTDDNTYDASTLYTTQIRTYTKTCKDIITYSDASVSYDNEVQTQEQITGIKTHHPYFTSKLDFKLSSPPATFDNTNGDVGMSTVATASAVDNILTTKHKSQFFSMYFFSMKSYTSSTLALRIKGDLTPYIGSVKDIQITTNTGVVRNCNRIDHTFTGTTTVFSCRLNAPILDHTTTIRNTTTGSLNFVLVD